MKTILILVCLFFAWTVGMSVYYALEYQFGWSLFYFVLAGINVTNICVLANIVIWNSSRNKY